MNVSINCKLSLYADDSALLFAHRNIDTISDNLSNALSNCKRWLVANKLSLHLGKTECLLFGSKKRLKGCENFRVTCDGITVNRVFCVRYLGVQLDPSLDGSSHVGKVLKAFFSLSKFCFSGSKV